MGRRRSGVDIALAQAQDVKWQLRKRETAKRNGLHEPGPSIGRDGDGGSGQSYVRLESSGGGGGRIGRATRFSDSTEDEKGSVATPHMFYLPPILC